MCLGSVFAVDLEMYVPIYGDGQETAQLSDSNYGVFFGSEPYSNAIPPTPTPETPIAGGISSGRHFYDIIVEVKEGKYNKESTVYADITIINKGDFPDKDTVLIYYLTDSDEIRFGETREVFYETEPGETSLTKSITLPTNTTLGEWKFHVEYYTTIQPLIRVFDSFEVVDGLGQYNYTYLMVMASLMVGATVFVLSKMNGSENY